MNDTLEKQILDRIYSYPLVDLLQMKVISLADGYCETAAPRNETFNGIYDSFHGGLLMTIADITAGMAILTKTGPDVQMATTDMNIRFLAPCLSQVTVKAKVIKFGKTMCPATADLFDADRKHVAVAQVSYMLLK
jgi:acyl-CoA thioesterase